MFDKVPNTPLVSSLEFSLWGSFGGMAKSVLKNTYEEVHLLVKLLVISLQAWKFTKNELLHTYFWWILARF